MEKHPHFSDSRTDELATDPSSNSLLVFNFGDAAFLRVTDFPAGLPAHEVIFLRMLAYLAFVDELAVPARLVLSSAPLMQAVELAAPLLREGIVRPERRSNTGSFSELAVSRGLDGLALDRARRLDEISRNPRSFRYDDLQQTYTKILAADLRADGAFRRSVSGAQKGRRAGAFDRLLDAYLASGDGTPENFAMTAESIVPGLYERALRWAMARYYSTPALFDDKNLREIPAPAAELLLTSRAKDQLSLPEPSLAPSDLLFQRLTAALPANRVSLDSQYYCDAILELRTRLPEAREVSKKLLEIRESRTVSREVSAMFKDELERQTAWSEPVRWKFNFSASLVGGAIGLVGDHLIFPGLSVLLAGGAGLSTDQAQRMMARAASKQHRPWVLAVEMMDKGRPKRDKT